MPLHEVVHCLVSYALRIVDSELLQVLRSDTRDHVLHISVRVEACLHGIKRALDCGHVVSYRAIILEVALAQHAFL